jgi:hypothetical protein
MIAPTITLKQTPLQFKNLCYLQQSLNFERLKKLVISSFRFLWCPVLLSIIGAHGLPLLEISKKYLNIRGYPGKHLKLSHDQTSLFDSRKSLTIPYPSQITIPFTDKCAPVQHEFLIRVARINPPSAGSKTFCYPFRFTVSLLYDLNHLSQWGG